MTRISRRTFNGLAVSGLALSGLGLAPPALAQRGPNVTVVVPYTAGSAPDLFGRLLTEHLHKLMDRTMIVENRVGASGNLGTLSVARATPDGTTLLVTANTIVMNPSLFKSLQYDPVKSFEPVAALVTANFALVVSAGLGTKTLAEFVAKAKAAKDPINYGSPGIGTPHHLCMELFRRRAGIELVHVPYRGLAPAVTDLAGGHISAMFMQINAATELAKQGRVHVLALMGSTRNPIAPEIATFAEQGIKDVDVDNWWAMFAPAGTPAAVVSELNARVNEVLKLPEVRKAMETQGQTPMGGPPAVLRTLVETDRARWAEVIKEANIALD
ncbi:tripartite tricarboxylate transporter substrate binding protein [Rhodoplanes sp. TEM]|uniref:Tripartite tricarboxylate transporter substrate binding protein n=1 Tax=Rhodoplanes tepidamans TaxID=200616 RepID=A0ABT5JBQ4_RHOTP|nr:MULTISPECIES: tripartite tricarboxylate transporter substrate binding protein [Rhodoplanes]MDC7786983.1 tripartite tricarboxylate transporter substrate binding protein [Rhodoplanes tepidamans]MDC7982866.1 tripartite tricarboxylate transporter substrate binding protein [Rhodoplanes sp. TEM]MDQ0354293.1 tripartite-type tricarboxylate transporter receptor subunit TctC [Rhodoplanes tepidamans]